MIHHVFHSDSCWILYSILLANQLLVKTESAVVPAEGSIVSNLFPLISANNPLVSGYTNPYYNQYKGVAIPIISYSSEHNGNGTYSFSFSTADGKQAQENGYIKDTYIDNAGEPQATQVVQGSYAYISPEGVPIQVSYVADENGFRPSTVYIRSDEKTVIPQFGHIKDKQIFLPLNRNNRYNYRNRFFGQYNNRLYDPRYPYDPTK